MNTLIQTPPEAISSIGAVWPPAPASDARLRGFYPELVVPNTMQNFMDDFLDRSFLLHYSGAEATRLTVRAIVKSDLIGRLAAQLSHVEAAVPLGGEHAGNHIVYFGAAKTGRHALSEDALATATDNMNKATSRRPQQMPDDAELNDHGLHLVTAKRVLDDETVRQFTELYTPFEYGEDAVRDIAANTNNTLLYLQNGQGQIVSSAMAEHAELDINGLGTVRIAEVTEATTAPGHRGNGYYRMVSGLLLSHLQEAATKEQKPVHAVFGESNLDPQHVAVLNAGIDNGRRLSFSDAAGLGINNDQRAVPFGILPHHVTIGQEVQSLAVSYLPLK